MDYDAVVDAFFTPPAAALDLPSRVTEASPARRLRDAAEPIAMHVVWSRRVNEALGALGLDFLGAYVSGRAASLGEADPGVVAASFAVFEPGLVTATYEAGRAAAPRAELLAVRTAATVASLREILEDADVEPVVASLRRGVEAAPAVGRPLFAGLAGQPWPEDPVGRLWRACELVREHRGDSHVAVCVAAGLDPVEMNVLTELWLGMALGSYTATRGWSGDAVAGAVARLERRDLVADDTLTDAGRAFRSSVEDATDDQERSIVDAIGGDLELVLGELEGWSTKVVDAAGFPPDPLKRAAG